MYTCTVYRIPYTVYRIALDGPRAGLPVELPGVLGLLAVVEASSLA